MQVFDFCLNAFSCRLLSFVAEGRLYVVGELWFVIAVWPCWVLLVKMLVNSLISDRESATGRLLE